MPRWPLLLPPPAVLTSTSPLRSCGSSSSIVVESPSHCPLPLSCRRGRAVPCRRSVPSITLNSPSRHPSPPITIVLAVHRRARSRRPSPTRSRRVPRRQGAITPSLTIKEPSRRPLPLPSRSHPAVSRRRGAVAPSLAIEEPSHRPFSSPSRSHRSVPHCRGAVAPSVAVEEPLHRTSPSRSHRP
jgi:hypothetical protein